MNITISDIIAARDIIRKAASRGAFTEPAEYIYIGNLYTKLSQFIESQERESAITPTKREDDGN